MRCFVLIDTENKSSHSDVVWGGRVVFCFFGAQNWEAHEKQKKSEKTESKDKLGGVLRNRKVAMLLIGKRK